MKAISELPRGAIEITFGKRTEVSQHYDTDYRGPLLICSRRPWIVPFSIPGHAVCVVDLVDVRKNGERNYTLILENPVPVKPFKVKRGFPLFEVDDNLIERAPFTAETPLEEKHAWYNENFFPLMECIQQREDGRWELTPRDKEKYGFDVDDVFPFLNYKAN